jgi:hypothetical protein
MALVRRIAEKLKRWDDRSRSEIIAELDKCVAMRATSAKKTAPMIALSPPLADVIKTAWEVGRCIDLSDIGYGPAHWEGGERFIRTPEPNYFFLAGLVRSQNFKRIFEVGTHYGGSILSMMRGITPYDNARLVTVDITDLNPVLHTLPNLTKLTGDTNTEEIIQKAVIHLKGEPIDLLYIDADHKFLPTLSNFCVYSTLLRPRMIVMDDIVLNDSMCAMWNVVRVAYGTEAVNCVDVIPEIRSSACGFGLLRLR